MNPELIFIIFAAVFALLGLFAIILLIVQAVFRSRRRAFEGRPVPAPNVTQIQSDEVYLRVAGGRAEVITLPEEEPPQAPAQPEDEDEEDEADEVDGVRIARSEKRTFAEKYELLPEDRRLLLDEFTAYITAKEDCSKQLKVSSLTFKFKKGQIAKAAIRRDSVELNFSIVNPEFGRMMRTGRTGALKVRPVQVRLNDRSDLEVAKQTADLTLSYLQGEEEYRSEKRKEARREAARRRREAAEETSAPDRE